MSWDSPLPTKLFMGAAAVVLLAGWGILFRDRTPVLSAPRAAVSRLGGIV